MGIYAKEFSPLNVKGNLLISVLIEQSFCKSVYFEIHEDNSQYYLYWNFEIEPKVLLPQIKRYLTEKGITELTMPMFEEYAKEREWQAFIEPYNLIHSCLLDDEDAGFFMEFIKNGLPELKRQKPQGLDGHSYEINVYDEKDEQYSCWCVIPKEWAVLEELIKRLCKYASLNERYLVRGIR